MEKTKTCEAKGAGIMDIFDGLTMVGGLSLFLFGMSVMGQALERRAGGRLRTVLGRLTTGKMARR